MFFFFFCPSCFFDIVAVIFVCFACVDVLVAGFAVSVVAASAVVVVSCPMFMPPSLFPFQLLLRLLLLQLLCWS